eukprot:6358885-Amphidinium_carterae.1
MRLPSDPHTQSKCRQSRATTRMNLNTLGRTKIMGTIKLNYLELRGTTARRNDDCKPAAEPRSANGRKIF